MNQLHLRYLIICAVATAVASIAIELFVLTLFDDNRSLLAGAALVAGWWTNLIVGSAIAILAGRKVAAGFIDPRMGKVLGTAMGLWVGIGALIGVVIAALFLLTQVPNADLRPGLVLVFGLISLGVCVVASAIAGRETAHPPEAEEEA